MEEIKVYNTLTKEKEVFHPIKEGEAKIYVCGVTPYNHPHIGNARPAVTWDIIRRYLEFIGYKVTFVQNFTDVDDKIINKANAAATGKRSPIVTLMRTLKSWISSMSVVPIFIRECPIT